MTRGEIAKKNFESGYNCAQAVLLSFSDLTQLDEATAMRLASSFGGGMGRLREVCGAVSASFMVAGLLYGQDGVPAHEEKMAHYAIIQELAAAFRARTGSIICRELIAEATQDSSPNPQPRTAAYYEKRPCGELCAIAADLLDAYIREHPVHT